MTEGENMLERCARALRDIKDCGLWHQDRGRRFCDDRSFQGDSGWRSECACKVQARAVIEALMTPTPEMVDAAVAPYRHGNTEQFDTIYRAAVIGYWRAMLRTASIPNEEGEGK
jgi:hypothetical protein